MSLLISDLMTLPLLSCWLISCISSTILHISWSSPAREDFRKVNELKKWNKKKILYVNVTECLSLLPSSLVSFHLLHKLTLCWRSYFPSIIKRNTDKKRFHCVRFICIKHLIAWTLQYLLVTEHLMTLYKQPGWKLITASSIALPSL